VGLAFGSIDRLRERHTPDATRRSGAAALLAVGVVSVVPLNPWRHTELGLPPRRYEIAGEVLARALEAAQQEGTPVGEAVARAADQVGRQIAAGDADLAELLSRSGFEPKQGTERSIHLANCPFHDLAARHPGLVCAMNLHLLRGLIGELGSCAQARLDPAEGRCCVTITLL
jgi:predicted ArsR family transcriptional regulator